MTTQRIIYMDDSGIAAVLTPTDEALQSYTIQEIAQKDVPNGKPYKIITTDDLPSDRDFRGAWEIDTALLTDGVGSEHDMFTDDPLHPDNN